MLASWMTLNSEATKRSHPMIHTVTMPLDKSSTDV